MTDEIELTQDTYVKYVVETINTYKKYSDALRSDEYEIFPQDVQYAMANYQSVKFGLLLEYQRNFRYLKTLKRKYEAWWNSKVSDSRKILLSSMPAGKFPALKEYSIKAQEDNAQEYNEWQERIQDVEDKCDFLKMLKTDWDGFQFVLQMLNGNMQSELKSLHIDRDYQPKVRIKRVQNESISD
jgi:hypothetical protein